MPLSEEAKTRLRSQGRHDLIEIDEINQSGYAGVDQNGTIVDRRKNPNAIPVQKNSLFGIPEAISLEDEPHPEFFQNKPRK